MSDVTSDRPTHHYAASASRRARAAGEPLHAPVEIFSWE